MAAVLTTPIPISGTGGSEGSERSESSDSSGSDTSDIYLSMRFWRRGDAHGMWDNIPILRDSPRPLNYPFNFPVGAMRPTWVDAPFPVAPDWFLSAAVSVDEVPVSVPVTVPVAVVPSPGPTADPAPTPADPAPSPAVPVPVTAPLEAPTTLHASGGFSMRLAFRVFAWERMDRVDVGEDEMVGMISGGLVRRWDY
jgi:hypothetical protein